MEAMTEKIIKLVLVVVLALVGLLYWILPRTRLAARLQVNETVFVVTTIVGVICGTAGLLVTFLFPGVIVELHLWELIVLPLVLINFYWLIVSRVRRTAAVLDEKQQMNLMNAAALTWAGSIPAMALLFVLYSENVLQGMIWFPYFLFVTLLIFSASMLFYFKRA